MSNNAMRRMGAALILLAKTHSSAASGAGRPNWARAYSSSLRMRGGASTEAIGEPASASPSTKDDPFKHLPRIEVWARFTERGYILHAAVEPEGKVQPFVVGETRAVFELLLVVALV